MSESQNAQILAHLKDGRWLTPQGALRQFGCARLAARIYDLRREGHKIEAIRIEVENHKGRKAHVCEYRLIHSKEAANAN